MHFTIKGNATLLASSALLFATSAVAADEKSPFSLGAEVGGRYDDNITIDTNDLNSRAGDSSLLLRANIGYDFLDNKKSEISARYNFSQSLHEDLKNFDLQIHGFTLNTKRKVGKVNLGINYRYNYITLGSEDYLDYHVIRPNIGLLVAKKTYLTAGYEYRTLDFKETSLADRNADRHSADAKLFFLLGKGKNITTGYKVSRHKAQTSALSYWSHTADAGLKLPFKLGETETTFRLRYQYRQKDYSGIHATIGAERRDKRHTMRAILEVPFWESFEGKIQYKYADSNSNLAVADYQNHEITFTLGWAL